MPLPLLTAALTPALFTADLKRRAEPGGSTLGECWRVRYYQFLAAEQLAAEVTTLGAVLLPFHARLLAQRATVDAVLHDPHLLAMHRAESEAIAEIIALIEAMESDDAVAVYLPIPPRALDENGTTVR
jgi:hypothetical protein